MGTSGTKPIIKERENNIYYNDGNLQDGNNQGNKTPKEKLRTDLKIILFLLMQQKELKNVQNFNEVKNFYKIKQTLKKYNKTYNINEIYEFTNNYYPTLSLKDSKNWKKMVDEVIDFTKIYNEDMKNKKDLEKFLKE